MKNRIEGGTSNQRHYSEKGGHAERGKFWRDVSELVRDAGRMRFFTPDVTGTYRDYAYMIRRNMLRSPQDGRR